MKSATLRKTLRWRASRLQRSLRRRYSEQRATSSETFFEDPKQDAADDPGCGEYARQRRWWAAGWADRGTAPAPPGPGFGLGSGGGSGGGTGSGGSGAPGSGGGLAVPVCGNLVARGAAELAGGTGCRWRRRLVVELLMAVESEGGGGGWWRGRRWIWRWRRGRRDRSQRRSWSSRC